MVWCCADGCKSCSSKGVNFVRFPVDPVRRKMWVLQMNRKSWEPKESTRLCVKHFKDDDFYEVNGRKRLKKLAVPTTFSTLNAYKDDVKSQNDNLGQIELNDHPYSLPLEKITNESPVAVSIEEKVTGAETGLKGQLLSSILKKQEKIGTESLSKDHKKVKKGSGAAKGQLSTLFTFIIKNHDEIMADVRPSEEYPASVVHKKVIYGAPVACREVSVHTCCSKSCSLREKMLRSTIQRLTGKVSSLREEIKRLRGDVSKMKKLKAHSKKPGLKYGIKKGI